MGYVQCTTGRRVKIGKRQLNECSDASTRVISWIFFKMISKNLGTCLRILQYAAGTCTCGNNSQSLNKIKWINWVW